MSTALLALIGQPVAHSRSPAMMAAALRAAGIDGVYVPREVDPRALPSAIEGLRALGFVGANVTLPHKVRALELMDHLDPVAHAVGAINTIVRRDGALIGHNTDADGVVAALREANHDPRGVHAVVLGTGGAARASAVGLARAGASSITVLGRRGDVALGVAAAARAVASECAAWGVVMPSPEANVALARAGLVVQGTPCGMEGGPHVADLLDRADLRRVRQGAIAMDLVYAPLHTPWLDAAAAAGLQTVGGVGVLVHQGASALRLWFNIEPLIEVMRQAVLESFAKPHGR